jgi:hypothetical protein
MIEIGKLMAEETGRPSVTNLPSGEVRIHFGLDKPNSVSKR